MVKHIVMWDLRPGVDPAVLRVLKNGIEDLKDDIDGVIDLEYIIEPLSTSTADVMLISTHKSFEDLKTYLEHPLHLEFSAKNKCYIENRRGFDYEY